MKQRKEFLAIRIYICIHILATFIIGLSTILKYESYGDAVGMSLRLSRVEIGFVLFVQMLTLVATYYFFLWTYNKRVYFTNKRLKFIIITSRMHFFVLAVLIVQIFFSLKTGNARIGHEVTSGYSFIMNLLNITAFFPIYFFCCRGGKIYWANVILYCVWKLICGWTGFVLSVAFYEMYLLIRENKYKILSQISARLYVLFSAFLILAGGWLYSYFYRIKGFVRYGYDIGKLTFLEGLNRLISRFTNFPVSLIGVQEHEQIVKLSNLQNNWYTETILTFRPLIPGFLWHGKENLRSFGNIVLQAIYPTLGTGTSSGYLCWVYWANILESDLTMFLFYAFALVIFFVVSKKIIYAFEIERGLLDFLYFDLIFAIFSVGVMESIFGYGYIGLIYILPIMILLGLIKVEWTK